MRFIDDSFDPDQALTIGVDFKTKKLTVDGNTVKLGIWVSNIFLSFSLID